MVYSNPRLNRTRDEEMQIHDMLLGQMTGCTEIQGLKFQCKMICFGWDQSQDTPKQTI